MCSDFQVQLSIQDVGAGWQRAFNRFTRFEDADEDLKTAAFTAVEQCMKDPMGRIRCLACKQTDNVTFNACMCYSSK